MKSKELKVLYYRQVVLSWSRFHFLHFPQCVAISHFYNNEYIIISGLTIGQQMSVSYVPLQNGP